MHETVMLFVSIIRLSKVREDFLSAVLCQYGYKLLTLNYYWE